MTLVLPLKNSLNETDSFVNTSPKWRSSLDEKHHDIRQLIQKTLGKQPQNSIVNLHDLSRLSVHSISYGFGLRTKTWKKISQERSLTPSPNYRLPSNKIELDRDQQENIRRMSTFKKDI